MSWLQKPATNRNAQYFSMNQPPSRWRVPQLHGPNTSLYKTSANSRNTESFTAALSLKISSTFSTLVSMALLLLLLLHIPETQKKKKTFFCTAAARRATRLDGVRARTSQEQKRNSTLQEEQRRTDGEGENAEKERKLVKMLRRRGWQWSSQCRRRHLVQGGNSSVQNRTVGRRVEGGVMLLRCQIQKRQKRR
jgi:septum formation inhibitor MinC